MVNHTQEAVDKLIINPHPVDLLPQTKIQGLSEIQKK